MTIQEMIQEMKATINATLDDAGKFDDGNKSAGTRVRKAMQEIKFQASTIRERISLIKNAE